MQTYLDLVAKTLEEGVLVNNRTTTPAVTTLGGMFEHDMAEGYPLLTTKKMPFRTLATELEFFIKGLTDKQWLHDRNCHIWDEWCNPKKVAHIKDDQERLAKQREEHDLGPIYGKQWRAFTSGESTSEVPLEEESVLSTATHSVADRPEERPHQAQAVDQLQNLVTGLKEDPTSRRLLVSAWNPLQFHEMALPPCHVLFQVTVIADTLSLTWFQRSADLMLGVPFNIASYALLLHLLAKESGYKEGKLLGMLSNIHIYENHLTEAREQLNRDPKPLPTITTPEFTSILGWSYTDTTLHRYTHHPKIKLPIAV